MLSGKERHQTRDKIRFFIGGAVLNVASLFTVYASTTYNWAIATSNTELIANAVIILFITDIDEMAHGILVAISPALAFNEGGDEEEDVEQGEDNNEEEQGFDGSLALLRNENLELKKQLGKLDGDLALQKSENSTMKGNMNTLTATVTRLESEMKLLKK